MATGSKIQAKRGKERPRLVADEIVEVLEDCGVEYAFGIPGGAIVSIFDALSRSKKIKVILTQHECSAAYMAMGRTMASYGKKIGVCFSTAGPGITNLITGVATAYEERVPIFVLTGNVSSDLIGRGAAQDAYWSGVDAVKMLKLVTSDSQIVFERGELEQEIHRMFSLCKKKFLPVHLNVPVNLASEKVVASKILPSPTKEVEL